MTAGMPIEQFVVSEVEAARSPSYGLGRTPEYDPRALGGATPTSGTRRWEGTSTFSHALGEEARAGASPSGALSGFFEALPGASGDEGTAAATTPSSVTVLFFFVAHCFFACVFLACRPMPAESVATCINRPYLAKSRAPKCFVGQTPTFLRHPARPLYAFKQKKCGCTIALQYTQTSPH